MFSHKHGKCANWIIMKFQVIRILLVIKVFLEIHHDLHKASLLWNEMTQFVYQLQYYILFEVSKCDDDSFYL